ncbi:3-oxoacyl-ACP synthase III family protein [Asticcacaulis excentricus]|uniref:Beta-ketoacyl-acyl-carrier-protein synthase I n=1 Tax=Asticcacaulis excentricus (strain ATCC 15261 / DSM 4724 / KCTC 12464 / NCIMB 9791 / VKM B-1370 / CB 48) TaxID=573065 RepID=E8RLG3_ASTEC|nr:3-oxoacyl-ACP synthase [Asticcacaulis excentricus]ADU13707.1 Beta-ketoacyl-acyl-carrier-protein synthase I [Asticcacaulis excentricus CB 48]
MERRFAIAGTGAYLPKETLSAAQYDALVGLQDGQVARRFGVNQRHRASAEETSSWMAAQAARVALNDAGWAPESLDVIISACGVMEQPIPGTAVLVQRALGLGASGIAAFDVNATCLSFLIAFDRALAGFALGDWRRVLIVSADIASAALDYSDPEASVLFGDGAAAIALEAGGDHQRLAYGFNTYSDAADFCQLEAGGTRVRLDEDIDAFRSKARFKMKGPALFTTTARLFRPFLQTLFEGSGVSIKDVDCVIPHQASRAALDHLIKSTGLPRERTIDVFADVGNLIATSLPFTLDHARRQGRLKPGEISLIIGSSAGVSLGGAVIRW